MSETPREARERARVAAGTPVSRMAIDYGPPLVPCPPRQPGTSDDTDALDRIQHMLRDPEWGVGMLEDIADIIRGTGREVENLPGDAPTWDRH